MADIKTEGLEYNNLLYACFEVMAEAGRRYLRQHGIEFMPHATTKTRGIFSHVTRNDLFYALPKGITALLQTEVDSPFSAHLSEESRSIRIRLASDVADLSEVKGELERLMEKGRKAGMECERRLGV